MEFFRTVKGQLISKCLYGIIVWTKIPTKILIVSALALSGQKLSNFLLVFWSKWRHFEINWPLKCPTWYSNLELTLLKALLLTLVNCSNQTNPKNQAFKTKWMKWPTLYQLRVSITNAANVMWIRLILQLFVYICKDFTSYPWYSNVSSAKRLLYRTKLMKQNSRVWQYWLWSFKLCADIYRVDTF